MAEDLYGPHLALDVGKHHRRQRCRLSSGHEKAGRHCTNSGTGILACCYIDSLGKVLTKGDKRVGYRFREFVRICMPNFFQADSTKALPRTPSGKSGGEHWLYEVYRNGFVHSYYPAAGAWGRDSDPNAKYWSLSASGRPTLIIDALVKGFFGGVEEFKKQATADRDLRANFETYITVD